MKKLLLCMFSLCLLFSGVSSAASDPIDYSQQVNFVELLRDHNQVSTDIFVKITGERSMEVMIPFKGNTVAQYTLQKSTNDDYIRLARGRVSTLKTTDGKTNPVPLYDVYGNGANLEFALSLKPFGTNLAEKFVPDHGTGTAFAETQSVYFDDQLITNWTPDTNIRTVKTVKIVQKLSAKHPDDPSNPMATIYSVHTISPRGVSFKVKVDFLQKLYSTTGFGAMFTAMSNFSTKMLTSIGNTYETTKTDGSITNLTKEADKANSFAFVSDNKEGGRSDIMMALTIQDPKKSFRSGAIDQRKPSMLWIQHRSTLFQKLYPQVYQYATINPGDSYEVGGTLFIGELPFAANLLK